MTDTSGLVEAVARLIDPTAFDQAERWTTPNFNVAQRHIDGAREDVERAKSKAEAILALPALTAEVEMPEPSPAMLRAGYAAALEKPYPDNIPHIWKAMEAAR